jgi:hypothetical protein
MSDSAAVLADGHHLRTGTVTLHPITTLKLIQYRFWSRRDIAIPTWLSFGRYGCDNDEKKPILPLNKSKSR